MSWKYVQRNDESGQYRTTDEGGGGGGSSTFAGLDDVSFSNLQNGQIPKYNSQTQKWENGDESGGGGTVTDVKVDGQSVVDPRTGEANITMPTPPTIPVEDVKVNGTSVVNANKEAQIKSYKEVTQAEYQALPSSKLTDNILYCIKDSAGADGFPPLIYSDEEREVGVWRDGKPLYQKSYIYENSSGSAGGSSGAVFDVWNLGNDKVIISGGLQCTFVNLATNKMYPLPYADSTFTNVYIDNGIVKLRVRNDDWGSNYKLYMTARYIKTTDTAGSGIWTTQGGFAHHYSTAEHVIGTWIDGKPVYEKTVDCGYLPNNSALPFPHGISNLKRIVSHEGGAINSSDTYLPLPKVSPAGIQYAVDIAVTSTDIVISTGNDRTDYYAYVTLRYTKTTD